jgi:PAS domain-containing protein
MLKQVLYFAFITEFYLCPVIPMTIKGITGIIYITISSTKISLKGSLFTASLLITLQSVNYIFDNNIDFQKSIIHAMLGSFMYLFAAFYLGACADKMKKKNKELQLEIEARKCAEKELRENLSLLESLMSTLPTPVSFKDLNYRYTGCNPAYEE